MSKRPEEKAGAVSRREFVGGVAAVGGAVAAMPLLNMGLEKAFASPFDEQTHGIGAEGEQAPPDRIIYTTCEQCNTFCTIKVTLTDPAETGSTAHVRKISGNPYSPISTVPYGQIPYATAPAEAAKGLGNMAVDGRSLRGGRTCLKGQAGIQTAYDAYRIANPLKRVGPRGSGKWVSLTWDQALDEISKQLKPTLAYVGRAAVAADWEKVKKNEMTQADFDAKYQDLLIDTKLWDLGPKCNQVAFFNGNRLDFMGRMVNQVMGSMNTFNHQSICGVSGVVANARSHGGKQVKNRQYADMDHCDYMIAWGTNIMTANKGPTWLAPALTNAIARGMKLVTVDPRLSKTAEKSHLWVPVKPGQDLPLAMGMIRWIIENKRYDARYLANPGPKAAAADGEPTWSDATHLVNVSAPNKPKLKAKDLGLGDDQTFVVIENGKPAPTDKAMDGQLEVDMEIKGMRVKSAFTLLKERAMEKTLAQYAELCGVSEKTIIEMARDFTSHGKRAVVVGYRGPAMHANGFYAVYALNILNFLIGNHDWKGGENSSSVRYAETKGKAYDLGLAKNGRSAWGIPITRERQVYEQSMLFARDGYPAKRRWTPIASNQTHEIIPSAYEGYPYPLKALFINRISPVESVAGGQFQADMLKDEQKIPLVVALDVTIGGTSQYADYILPDATYLERWGLQVIYPNQNLKESHFLQPACRVMDGPRPVEEIMIDLAKRVGLPGVGDNAFADGQHLHTAEDYYLKIVANIAYDETPVPDASADEQQMFVAARKAALGPAFDEKKWRAAVKPEEWAKVVYVLNRGGRFAPKGTEYEGEWLKMRHAGVCNLYDEVVARSKNSYDGKLFDGLPRLEPEVGHNGKPVADSLPLQFTNWKSSHLSTHRNIGNAWLREVRQSNPVWMNPKDAAARGLAHGDAVIIRSATAQLKSEVFVTEAIRPGVVGADFSYGHETYGAKAMEINGKLVPAAPAYGHTGYDFKQHGTEPTGYAPARGTGIRINDVIRIDSSYANKGTPLCDPIGGSVAQFSTWVEVVKA